MDNEELEELLREMVQAAVTIADNVESIATVLQRAEERLDGQADEREY